MGLAVSPTPTRQLGKRSPGHDEDGDQDARLLHWRTRCDVRGGERKEERDILHVIAVDPAEPPQACRAKALRDRLGWRAERSAHNLKVYTRG